MYRGWFCYYRKIWDNPRSRDSEWLSVWTYLMSMATHKEIDTVWNGERIKLADGQLITGRKSISIKTGVSESKVNRILKRLKIEQQIEQQTCSASSLISITNWDAYQKNKQQIEQRVNNERTTSEQRANTNNNVNNVNNVNKDTNTVVDVVVFSEMTNKLTTIVSSIIKVNKNSSKSKWTTEFKRLHQRDGIKIERINRVLDGYGKVIGQQFIPEAFSAKAFRAKFIQIERALAKRERNGKRPIFK